MMLRRAILGLGLLGLALWIGSLLTPWFSIDQTMRLPNFHGHGPSSFSSHVRETLWFWELERSWPFFTMIPFAILGGWMTLRGFRTGLLALMPVVFGTPMFIGFQWLLEGIFISRDLHIGPFVALLGATLMGLGSLGTWIRRAPHSWT